MQVGDFRGIRGLPAVPLTRISCNTVFSKSQNTRKALYNATPVQCFMGSMFKLLIAQLLPRYFVTDRTENNRVFDDLKILTVAALFLILNYAFAIGNLFMVFFLDLWDLGHATSCVNTNDIVWIWSVIFNNIHYLGVTVSGICADLALHR